MSKLSIVPAGSIHAGLIDHGGRNYIGLGEEVMTTAAVEVLSWLSFEEILVVSF